MMVRDLFKLTRPKAGRSANKVPEVQVVQAYSAGIHSVFEKLCIGLNHFLVVVCEVSIFAQKTNLY